MMEWKYIFEDEKRMLVGKCSMKRKTILERKES
jgi:hypothetical protein